MKKEIPDQLVLPMFGREVVIGHELIDQNHHANHARQHSLYVEERQRHMQQLGKVDGNILNRFGKSPFISHIVGSYRKQMLEGDRVTINTNVEITGSEIVFSQAIVNDQGENASEFKFAALGIGQNRAVADATFSIKDTQSSLYEFTEEVNILPEWVDGDGHLSVEGHFLICEIERINQFEKLVMDEKILKGDFRLRPVVARVTGVCNQQLFEGDILTACTVSEDKMSHILFTQSLFKDGIKVSRFQFAEVLIDEKGKPNRVPEELRVRLREINDGKK